MTLLPSGTYRKTKGIIRRGIRASQPLAITVLEGTLYFVTDERVIERSNGTTWDSYSNKGLIEQTTSVTGTQNDFDLNGHDVNLICSNASAVIFNGFKVLGAAPTTGDKVTIQHNGITTLRAGHQETGSTAVNRIIGESLRGQIVGASGSITLIYDGANSRWRIDNYNVGTPITIPYVAGDFTGASPMVFTVDSGDLIAFNYRQFGTRFYTTLTIYTASLTVTATGIVWVKLPNGFTVSGGLQNSPYGSLFDGVAWAVAMMGTNPATFTDKFQIFKFDSALYALNNNNTYFFGSGQINID